MLKCHVYGLTVKCYCEREENSVFFVEPNKMFGNAIAKLPHNYGILRTLCPAVTAVRHGHRIRGKPFGVAKSLEQRIECKLPFEVMFVPLALFMIFLREFGYFVNFLN